MSAIASFYLIHIRDIPEMKAAAALPAERIRRKILWFEVDTDRWNDPYVHFLQTTARELADYEWSGYFILDTHLFLDSNSIDMVSLADQELSDYLDEKVEVFSLVFRSDEAGKLLRAVDDLRPGRAAVEDFLNSDGMKTPTGPGTPVEAVLDCLDTLKGWLSQVDTEHIGVLHVW